MSALLDINCLIALFDAAHVHHRRAHQWLIANRADGWATCPLTQNGVMRILSQPNYPSGLQITEVARRLAQATAASDHEFWPDDLPISDAKYFDHAKIRGAKALTDIYLLALAVRRDGHLVTFDHGIATAAVRGTASRHLVLL